MSSLRIEFHEAPFGDAQARVDAGCAALDAGRRAHGLEPRSAALWAWRAANPAGCVIGVAREGTRVVAALAALGREVRLEGERSTWYELVELFNDFEGGRGLARTAGYLELKRTFAQRYGGRLPEGAPVVYGLPTRRAHRIGLARLGYEILRSENVMLAPPETYETKPGCGVEVSAVACFPEDVEALFGYIAQGRGAIGVRDAAWLNWRFVEHPERAYQVATARRDGQLVGYVVLRLGSYAGHTGGVLADWLVPTEDYDAGWELLTWAADRLRSSVPAGTDPGPLIVGVSDKSPEWAAFQAVAFHAHGTREYMVFRGFQKPYIMSWLFANWHYTLADSERG